MMKKILMLMLITSWTAAHGNLCDNPQYKSIPRDAADTKIEASDKFKTCITLSEGNIAKYDQLKNSSDWIPYYCKAKRNNVEAITNEAAFRTQFASEIRNCLIGAHILKKAGREYNNPDHIKDHSQKPDPMTGIRCQTNGIDTLDYESCSDFVNHANTAEVTQGLIGEGQKLNYEMNMQDEAAKAAKSTDTATAALSGQKASFENQEKIMNQQALMEGAKLAVLQSDYSGMPDYETVKSYCADIGSKLGDSDLEINKETCEKLVVNPNNFAFLPNRDMQEKMKTKLIAIGGKAAMDLLAANMLGKRANDVGNAIATINGVQPIDPTAPTGNDLQTNFCQISPSDPQCTVGGLNRTFDATGGENVIDFGGGASGTIYSPGTMDPNSPNAGTTNGAVANTPNATGNMGTNATVASQAGGLKDTAAAAKVESKPLGGGGGGGGGGGSAGGGGGGGGGPAPGAGNPGGLQAAVAGRAPTYSGGGGSLSMMGGFGINKPKDKTADSENPFGKLFDKNGPKGDSTLNFRGPASAMGDKKDNLFQMITKRYNTVSTDKRLLEYELGK